uniref:chitinase n=1 Tax=Phaseolus vulgaris TaxID=3885 RepID=Q9LEB2_PHAVU|nr:putative class I chitinase [Phaseolus vulgaris]
MKKNRMMIMIWSVGVVWMLLVGGSYGVQCGTEAGGALCPRGLCCSQWGWCGSTIDYCGPGCQSQCGGQPSTPPPPPPTPTPSPPPPTPTPPSPPTDLSALIPESTFEQMLKHRNNAACPARGFYTYDAFIAAAKSYPSFGNTGDTATRKREIAAFLGQTSHETTGGWATAPDGPFAWGYCFVREVNPGTYCSATPQFPCAPGQQYYGRGPIQLSWNYNYAQCGRAIGVDLLNNPDLVATDSVISFKSALWFWMTAQSPKPSSHDVITSRWTPSSADVAARRLPGYGTVTNIINGGLECGRGQDSRVQNRIGFFKRYCDMLGIGYGNNLDCNSQTPFGNSLFLSDLVTSQ